MPSLGEHPATGVGAQAPGTAGFPAPLTFIKARARRGGYLPTVMNTELVDVDARGLEPPQPMLRILEALAALAVGATLRARTDRRPMHLYPLLAERGFTAETEEQSDGSFVTHIRRA